MRGYAIFCYVYITRFEHGSNGILFYVERRIYNYWKIYIWSEQFMQTILSLFFVDIYSVHF